MQPWARAMMPSSDTSHPLPSAGRDRAFWVTGQQRDGVGGAHERVEGSGGSVTLHEWADMSRIPSDAQSACTNSRTTTQPPTSTAHHNHCCSPIIMPHRALRTVLKCGSSMISPRITLALFSPHGSPHRPITCTYPMSMLVMPVQPCTRASMPSSDTCVHPLPSAGRDRAFWVTGQ